MTKIERVAEVCGCVTTTRIKLGLCDMHYQQHRAILNPQPSKRKPQEYHFWKRVNVRGPDECWRWTGSHDRGGYGRFTFKRDGRTCGVSAHRYAYEMVCGPIPDGLQLDHVRARGCVHRDCVNPKHLEPVTTRENLLRGSTWAGVNAAKNVCPQGHPYDIDVPNSDGSFRQRACSVCRSEANARYRRNRSERAS